MNDSQRKILQYIRDYRATALVDPKAYKLSPTIREIATYMKMAVGSIQDATAILVKEGFLTHTKGIPASYVPTEKKE